MAIIIRFPAPGLVSSEPVTNPLSGRVMSGVLVFIWMLVAMTWPVLRWIVAFDVTVQLFRMLLLFVEKGVFVDWTFIGHFFLLVALTYFGTVYQPRS